MSPLLVLGSVNRDLVWRGPCLPRPGETVVGGEFYQAAGGKGANQAVAAARAALGRGKVTFLGAVGDDSMGQELRASLEAEKIDCSHLKTATGHLSGVALILVDQKGENLIGVASGANAQLSPADVEALPDALFQKGGVLLACLELPVETVRRGLVRARQSGLLTILNPAPVSDAAAVRTLLPLVDVLTPNELELAALAGCEVPDAEAAAKGAKGLQAVGAAQIIVTLGRAGGVLVNEAGAAHPVPPFPTTAIDSTAAGDCFSGTLAVALAGGQSLLASARFAAAAAAISVSRRGAQPSLPRRDEIEHLLQSAMP